jgi:NAD(P)H-dependent flavin oxidoreductase YrpB (nitropropane dioxygenase family)
VYGDRDIVDLATMREIGLPFWLAGGVGSPDGLARAQSAGAVGIQVGTLFAYCDESGVAAHHRTRVLQAVAAGEATVYTDPRASPTGYPFKVVELPGDRERAAQRTRICDLGYLRTAVRGAAGRIDYRCPAEPVSSYVAKGGDVADTEGRRCLCNGLTANIGQPQVRDGGEEMPLLTSGDDLLSLSRFLRGAQRYSAKDVIAYLSS